jgi:hypothetical protein
MGSILREGGSWAGPPERGKDKQLKLSERRDNIKEDKED